MGEVKQTNFRIDQDSAAAFRRFCEDNGMNQAQGFDHVMQVIELDRAKTAVPGRTTEIEEFERSVKDIMAAYLDSIETNNNAEARIREQFSSDLTRKDKTIDELRQKVKQLQAERDDAEIQYAAAKERESAATSRMEAAQRTTADQERSNSMLTLQLTEATEKLNGAQEAFGKCRTLEATVADLRAKLSEAERALENEKKAAANSLAQAKVQADLALENEKKSTASNLAQAKVQAELDTERAVIAKEREMQAQLRETDKENARLSAMLDQLQQRLQTLQQVQEAQAARNDG